MSAQENGGPAFPSEVNAHGSSYHDEGMTLRDFFAAKALAGMLALPEKSHGNRGSAGVPILAAFAYEYADAMLAERAKP